MRQFRRQHFRCDMREALARRQSHISQLRAHSQKRHIVIRQRLATMQSEALEIWEFRQTRRVETLEAVLAAKFNAYVLELQTL